MNKEELKDEMKNRISLALKDPILQQGFEIICKENAELKERGCWKSCEYANPKAELIGQHIKDVQNLTKAKEIIKKLIDYPRIYGQASGRYKHECDLAGQFLRETDIDNAIQKANEGLDLDKIADEVEQDIKESEVEK